MKPAVRALAVLLFALTSDCAAERVRREGARAFEQGAYEEAIAALEHALQLDPGNLELRLELRTFKETAVQRLLAQATSARESGNTDGAAGSFRRALKIEPGNERAQRGLEGVQTDRRHAERLAKATQLLAAKQLDAAEVEMRAVLTENPGFPGALALLQKLEQARGPIPTTPRLKTQDDRPVSLQFRDAPTKTVFEVLARKTGINFIFDKEVKSEGKTTIFVNSVPVEQAIDMLLAQNQLARLVLSENTVLVYPNTPAKQKDYRDEVVHTFYLASATPKDAESMLKAVLASKNLFADEHSNTLTMRDTPERIRMAEKLLASIDVPEPEVVMEVEVLEITHSQAQQLGITYPSSFSASITKPPNSDGAGSSTAGGSGLVWSDLFKQNKNTIAVSSLGMSVDLSKTLGSSNVLSSPRIRARNKEKAKILVGNRLPVVTSGTSATAGGAFSTSNVQYIEVGLTLEVQPTIHNDGNVAIQVKLEVSSILKQVDVPTSGGGSTRAYEIGTRNTSTLLELKDGETQVLAGLISANEQENRSYIPGLGDLPLLGRLFGSNGSSRDRNEVVLSITPRIVRTRQRPPIETSEFWYGSETQPRSAPLSAASAPGTAGASGTAAGPFVPGAVSFGAGNAVASASTGSSAPRALPSRIDSAAGPPPTPPTADGAPEAKASKSADAPPGDGSDAKPQVTIEGPDTAKVGEEIAVAIRLSSGTAFGRVRTQVGFDASALQLVSAEPGDLATGDAPKVTMKSGGVQLELVGGDAAPVAGSGGLLNLRFRAVAVRPATSIATQVVLVGEDGVAVAATQATPLKISLVK